MRILYVCTANICRSVSGEYLMRDAVAALRVPEVQVASAGVAPVVGAAGCEVAPALRGRATGHRSKPVTAEAVEGADLILTAAREHQTRIADVDPAARRRTYTMRQAGRIAGWLLAAGMPQAGQARTQHPEWRLPPDDPRSEVSPLTPDWTAWVVEEMDAARGLAPLPAGAAPDDIADPHAGNPQLHAPTYQQIWEATNALASLFQMVHRLSTPG